MLSKQKKLFNRYNTKRLIRFKTGYYQFKPKVIFGPSQLTTPKYKWYELKNYKLLTNFVSLKRAKNVQSMLLKKNSYNFYLLRSKKSINPNIELSKIGFDKNIYLNLIKKNMFSIISFLNVNTTINQNKTLTLLPECYDNILASASEANQEKHHAVALEFYKLDLEVDNLFRKKTYYYNINILNTHFVKGFSNSKNLNNRLISTTNSTNNNKLLSIHESIFTNFSYYNDLNSYNKPIRTNATINSKEKMLYLKNFLLSDWIQKKFLLNSKYFSRDIKHELISNYFINKVFARRFKGFDSLAYEPKFKLELFPYSNNNYWKAYKFIFLTYLLDSSNNIFNNIPLPPFNNLNVNNKNFFAKNILGSSMLTNYLSLLEMSKKNKSAFNINNAIHNKKRSPYLFTNSVEYSVPIHFDTRMTKNLFRDLINSQKAGNNK